MGASRRFLLSICTNGPPEAARDSLAAACEQASAHPRARVLLVASGVDEAVAAADERMATELGAEFARSDLGASAARNRALAAAADDEVLAFLDDDVIPAPDWLERLDSRWVEAAEGVVCIGGPVRPRWGAPPPRWVGPGLETSFALLDLGPGLRQLNPGAGEDLWTANASFLAAPLREAGGFDPGLGPWGGVALIGEDTQAQRALAARGGRVLYAGDVRVEHLIGPARLRLRDLWRRERGRGTTAVLLGDETPAAGAARAVKAAAGLTVALARREPRLSGERLARLARAAGAATAPLVTRRLRTRGWPG